MISSREVIKTLKANGWELVGTVGDHHNFKKGGKGAKVTVQHPVKDLSLRNIISIEKATGIRLRP
jgi:predicted RNA binding protein YcfA (HicA-like mRNA interferase family)